VLLVSSAEMQRVDEGGEKAKVTLCGVQVVISRGIKVGRSNCTVAPTAYPVRARVHFSLRLQDCRGTKLCGGVRTWK
jgi:hypothetical protein